MSCVCRIDCGQSYFASGCELDGCGIKEAISKILFLSASYLTDPVCQAHEFYWRARVVDVLDPAAAFVTATARRVLLYLGVLLSSVCAIVTTVPGICLRACAVAAMEQPFFASISEEVVPKQLPVDGKFSLFSWNLCAIPAGYSIRDGGVIPWHFRMQALVETIAKTDADVNCLYEVFDYHAAHLLEQRCREMGYAHIYWNIGPRAIGISSGIFVASKFVIQNPDFTPFCSSMLIGATKFAGKGVFSFDLVSGESSFATIHATHLQHSEIPEHPEEFEEESRARQMKVIWNKIKQEQGRAVIVTGDLNMTDDELAKASWRERFQKGDVYRHGEFTWGGDSFCAHLVGKKKTSGPLNLDHTIAVRGSVKQLSTTLVATGFDGRYFHPAAQSDHAGQLCQIMV
jgi:exonuclease III